MAAGAIVGVSDHAGWAVLLATTAEGALLLRRRVELLDEGLPCLPHHHEAQGLPEAEAIALVATVRASAERHAAVALAQLAEDLKAPVVAIALRACPKLPPTVPEILADYQAQCVADTVMIRQALAQAAEARGWAVRWFDPRKAPKQAAQALGLADAKAHLDALGKAAGRPWTQDHRLAWAGAIASQAAEP